MLYRRIVIVGLLGLVTTATYTQSESHSTASAAAYQPVTMATKDENGAYNYEVLNVEDKATPADYTQALNWSYRIHSREEQTQNEQSTVAIPHNSRDVAHWTEVADIRHSRSVSKTNTCSDEYILRHARGLGDLLGRSFRCAMNENKNRHYKPAMCNEVCQCNQTCRSRCSQFGDGLNAQNCFNNCIESNCMY